MNIAAHLVKAVRAGDAPSVRAQLKQNSKLRADLNLLNQCLVFAKDNVDVIEALVDTGADINASDDPLTPEGAIVRAVDNNAIAAVRWMLAHGAKLNHTVDGQRRCFALISAVIAGNLDMVKLLVDNGAEFNATWRGDSNALSYAIMYHQSEIEQYLRLIGAKEPRELVGGVSKADEAEPGNGELLAHIREQLGEPEPLSLFQIAGLIPQVRIHAIVRPNGTLALVTAGMSERPLNVPPGQEVFRHAELVMFLPGDWPRGPQAISDSQWSWPYHWMMKLAGYPHESGSWLPPATIVDCGGPLSPMTRMSCLLLLTEDSEFAHAQLPSGRTVVFYFITPLYPEERDLEQREGIDALLERLQRSGVNKIVNPRRPSLAE